MIYKLQGTGFSYPDQEKPGQQKKFETIYQQSQDFDPYALY